VLALGITFLSERTELRPDAVITFSFAGSLALGLVILSSLDRYRLVEGILFGNIYALNTTDLIRQAALAAGLVVFFLVVRRRYLLALVQPDLARLQGHRTDWLHYALALAVALTVASCIKMVGALLLGALIVIPAATGRVLGRSFAAMTWIALAAGLLGPSLGVVASLERDLPTGPTVVLTSLALLGVSLIFSAILARRAPRVQAATRADPER
jgi:ABC-type Mn2+/Zn2+ transport system permease subunit